MVQFKKLRLTGFKSFVDTTDLEIGTGLTGIIGPNGCGKSNLVEALRWAMGETSAKRMRGAGMEDVIFNGTSARAARNSAEVTLWLDNTDRKAPAELNHSDELEIKRKIEKDSGSTYKVNGKTVRARDVQLLFADSSIGANSPALVSQGRVADLISAKPTQRRLILEEAAGISGLHARRHEAELKLKAAENNLTRLEDVMGTMVTQLQGLQKQARQANRYRNLSGHIQRAEAIALHLKWQTSSTAVERAREAFNAAEAIVREQMQIVAAQTTKQTERSALLPELRQKESQAAAALQRFRLAYNTLESEEHKILEETSNAKSLLEQSDSDIAHETSQKEDATSSLARLTKESENLCSEKDKHADRLKVALSQKEDTAKIVFSLDQNVSKITEKTAHVEAQKNTLIQQISDIRSRIDQLQNRFKDDQNKLSQIEEETPEQHRLNKLEKEIEAAEILYQETKSDLECAENKRTDRETDVSEARQTRQLNNDLFTQASAEADALNKLLSSNLDGDEFKPVVESLYVKSGFEKALAVALGEDLQAALDKKAPIYWSESGKIPPSKNAFPEGVKNLLNFVTAPKALEQSLSQIAIVDTVEQAEKILCHLKPGQSLVSKNGAAWRWDGLVIKTEAANPSAIRLEQKNRLAELADEVANTKKDLLHASSALEKCQEKRQQSIEKVQTLRNLVNTQESDLYSLRNNYKSLSVSFQKTLTTISNLKNKLETTQEDLESATSRLSERKAELETLPDSGTSRDELELLKEQLFKRRQEFAEQQSLYEQLKHETQTREHRLQQIQNEETNYKQRIKRMDARLSELNERTLKATQTLQTLSQKPSEIETTKQELLTHISTADQARTLANDTLLKVEMETGNIQRQLKAAEEILSQAREDRAMAQANVSTSEHTLSGLEEQILEKFNCPAHSLLKHVEVDPEKTDLPSLEQIQSKLERLIRERENMGPVNLRAEVESQELTDEMETMQTEHDDLLSAINKLRHGISRLNKEARERLMAAFDTVNHHFEDLFTRLFGGGKAYLELVDDDDPLKAGLQIFAQPPGKKLQVLSLFSGGEQTLTSIALIFAMFLTNPAPICVLDEIDAPLDDSNVDRVCSLLEELKKRSQTRFIVISHHRMTMARMDRLYGVTMSERGISQLVSVDLQQHEMLLEAAE